MISHEKPTRRNPRELTVDQHFHSAHSISKFYNNDSRVDVCFLSSGVIETRHKKAKIFCAQRNWDQRAETLLMHPIEDKFHDQIDNVRSYEKRDHEAITEYFHLWKHRFNFHVNRESDAILPLDGDDLTKEEEEILESKGAMFCRKDGVMPSRFITGGQIQLHLMRDSILHKNRKWGLLTATDGEFLIADNYRKIFFMPISPTQAFIEGHRDQVISRDALIEINNSTIANAHEFYFAKNIKNCPV